VNRNVSARAAARRLTAPVPAAQQMVAIGCLPLRASVTVWNSRDAPRVDGGRSLPPPRRGGSEGVDCPRVARRSARAELRFTRGYVPSPRRGERPLSVAPWRAGARFILNTLVLHRFSASMHSGSSEAQSVLKLDQFMDIGSFNHAIREIAHRTGRPP